MLLEHSFWCREQDVERGVSLRLLHFRDAIYPATFYSVLIISFLPIQVLSLPPVVAPTKVLIVPLSAKEEFDPLVREVCES